MSTQVSDDVLSNPFTVYSAKNFPGMTGNNDDKINFLSIFLLTPIIDSTAISQCFAQQGIKISIRKGRRIRRIVDHTHSNNTVVDTQQKALASSISSSATSYINNRNNNTSNNNNLNISHDNSSNNNHNTEEKNVIVEQAEKHEKEAEATTASEQSATASTSEPKPTYRRIDISTFLTPSNS
jgi:hypothetical protein